MTMARNNRRKQQTSGRLTPSSTASSDDMDIGTGTTPTAAEDTNNNSNESVPQEEAAGTSEHTSPAAAAGSGDGDDDNDQGRQQQSSSSSTEKESTGVKTKKGNDVDDNSNNKEEEPLVLTSEKRRGVYECDYCHKDISQEPRIRCAVCTDFDLCLDCFTTTDHEAAVARLKAAAETHSELKKDGLLSSSSTSAAASKEGDSSIQETANGPRASVVLSSAALTHEAWHGYKVCDSTRYPVFPGGRIGGPNSGSGVVSVFNSVEDYDTKNSATSVQDMDTDQPDDAKMDDRPSSAVDSRDVMEIAVLDDPKVTWTAEEDLRLLDAIKTHGLGNWVDISEAISGSGSSGKTPKRCMERYFDDFLGRYGFILPKYTVVEEDQILKGDESALASKKDDSSQKDGSDNGDSTEQSDTPAPSTPGPTSTSSREDEGTRSSKRKTAASRLTPSILAAASMRGTGSGATRKRMKIVETETLPALSKYWPRPYLPPIDGIKNGQEVARDLSAKAEQAYFKSIMSVSTKAEADNIRAEYVAKYKDDPIGAPTVLPPRPEDAAHLPGAELAGYMPRRGDFDVEWDNSAEDSIADMEFSSTDTPQEKQIKLQVLDIYCRKLDEREKRKNFILTRHLYDYRKYIENDKNLPADERDLIHRMRLFERFHTNEEHQKFIEDLLKAKRLRKEIAKLQMYRRIGIRTLAEAERYELDKQRRQFHKMAFTSREQEAKAKASKQLLSGSSRPSAAGAAAAAGVSAAVIANQIAPTDSLWKQYRTNDRKMRRSSSRSTTASAAGGRDTSVGITTAPEKEPSATALVKSEGDKSATVASSATDTSAPMDIDEDAKQSVSNETKAKEEGVGAEDDSGPAKLDQPGAASTSNEQPLSNSIAADEKEAAASSDKPADSSEAQPKADDIDGKPSEGDQASGADQDEKKNKNNTEAKNEADGGKAEEEQKLEPEEFDASREKGHELLSKRELALCNRLKIYPMQYLPVKKALIQESFNKGLLDRSSSSKRTVCKIDIVKRGPVVDFLIRAGWVDSKLRQPAMSASMESGNNK